ncbi:MAG: ABC transporter permease [Phycisphaeraceae bacterium]
MIPQIAYIGQRTTSALDQLGAFVMFSLETLMWTIRGTRTRGRFRLLMPQLFAIGTMSIAVVCIVGGFVGMVLAVEAYDQFAAIGQERTLGGIINISVVRQIGPVLAAVMIAGRVGGAVSAQLGTMRVTEQLDALRVMGADPVAYLVVPRVIACLIMVPMLTVFSNLVGIAGGYLVTVHGYGVNGPDYWDFSAQFVGSWDVITGVIKSVFFGLAIGLISCYNGFTCKSGAAGVGRAATDSFVTSFIAIIVLNLFLAKFLKDFYHLLFGVAGDVSALTG